MINLYGSYFQYSGVATGSYFQNSGVATDSEGVPLFSHMCQIVYYFR